jgi:hydrogenase expression/formation protein HypC
VEVLPDDMLRGRIGGSGATLDLSSLLLPEPAAVGDYVIVHAGFALHTISPSEAEESLALFRSLAGTPVR